MKRKILIVDDEKSIVNIIAFNLKKAGHEPLMAYDGEEALNIAFSDNIDLILLDIMMPKIDGFEVCKKIREKSQVPIIMLTARAEEIDKVLGLELGADDYITKPFSINELMARVKANLRRSPSETQSSKSSETKQSILVFEDIVIDEDRIAVFKRGVEIELTKREYELLRFLATQKDKVFTRESLLEKVWDYEYFGDVRTVDVTVRRLREKIEDEPGKPSYILTKRGVGYYFANPKI